jgi:glycosyltransferase involved in cell wall biosynthesis
MKIAYYSHYFSPEIGAPSARIFDFGRKWLDAGHRVSIVTCFPNHPTGKLYPGYSAGLYQRENMNGLDVHRHWTYITPNRGFLRKSIGHASFLPSALLFSNRRMPVPEVAIGTSPTFFAAMAAAAMARRNRIPFVMEVRDLWPAIFVELGVLRNRRLIRLLEMWELWLYRRATKVITVTESFRSNIIRRGISGDKVATVPNGADIEFWKPVPVPAQERRRLGLAESFVVLYIGAHGISHGLSSVLGCAALLRDRPAIKFLFVGDGAEKEKLVRQAREAGLENVQFLDPVDRRGVREYYALADVCIVPLRNIPLFDTFIPSKMFEIMAMARPIIGALRGEAADILSRSGGAAIVEPEDSVGMAKAVRTFADQPGRARDMGIEARRFVAANYSRRTLAQRYLEQLEDAIRTSGQKTQGVAGVLHPEPRRKEDP